jgi:hypothetical protein
MSNPKDCFEPCGQSGHPSAGAEAVEMLRDGDSYGEMGQFTDGRDDETSWRRVCA